MESNSESTEGAPPEVPARISFDYIKSNFFRVVHADGVIGGLTPHLDIQMSFWSERSPIPQHVEFEVSPAGMIGNEIRESRKGRDAIVREVEVMAVLRLQDAKAIRDWLDKRIQEAEAYQQQRDAKAKN